MSRRLAAATDTVRQVERFAPRRRATAVALPLWTTRTLDARILPVGSLSS
ncbi:MAG: hypothetical protein ACOH17_11790 [Cellulomonas sp.]